MDVKFGMIGAAALIAAAVTAPMAVSAASSECKGLDQANCQGKTICSWVKAHKTKTRDVAAFCRKKPEKKTSQAAPAPKS